MLVAGAGLAGLTAAFDLVAMGAAVTVIEARDRVGGRVWTIREGFSDRQHAEAGGDMIDEAQTEIRDLAASLGLTLTRILRDGFGYVRPDKSGQPKIVARSVQPGWERLATELEALVRERRPRAELELVVTLGAVIGAHAGPGTLALFWFRDGD